MLERIFDVLRKEVKARRPKRKKKIELSADTNNLSNLFSNLEVEEPLEQLDSSQPSESSRTSKDVPKQVEIELEGGLEQDSMAEHFFALYCHFTGKSGPLGWSSHAVET